MHAMDVLGRDWPLLKKQIGDPQVATACKAYVDAVLQLRQADDALDNYFGIQGTEMERVLEQTRLLNEATTAKRIKDRTHHALLVLLMGEENVPWELAEEDEMF